MYIHDSLNKTMVLCYFVFPATRLCKFLAVKCWRTKY